MSGTEMSGSNARDIIPLNTFQPASYRPVASPSRAFDALTAMVRETRSDVDATGPDAALMSPYRPTINAREPSAPTLAEVEERERNSGLPSSWYRGEIAETPDFNRDLMRAAILGLVTGLVIVLPILWSMQPEVPQFTVEGATELSLVAARGRHVSLSTSLPPTERMRALVELARMRILAGDVLAARTVLSRADVARDPDALFLMAETYDPHRLAIWGSRGTEGDPLRARALYAAANALGHAEADNRLEALKSSD